VVLRDSSGGNTAGIDITGGIFTIHLFGSTPIFATGTDNAPQVPNAPGNLASYSSSTDSFCALTACNNGNDPAVPITLSSVGHDVFTASSNSLEVVFSLSATPTSTPEPSSLAMLAIGLFGLTAFALRRKQAA
jgi:hypothetical protein